MEVQFYCCPFGLTNLAGYLPSSVFDPDASGVNIIDIDVGNE